MRKPASIQRIQPNERLARIILRFWVSLYSVIDVNCLSYMYCARTLILKSWREISRTRCLQAAKSVSEVYWSMSILTLRRARRSYACQVNIFISSERYGIAIQKQRSTRRLDPLWESCKEILSIVVDSKRTEVKKKQLQRDNNHREKTLYERCTAHTIGYVPDITERT